MCTIVIGASFDKRGVWYFNTHVLDDPIHGLDRKVSVKSSAAMLDEDMDIDTLRIERLTRMSMHDVDSKMAVIQDNQNCFAIPCHRLLTTWNHRFGKTATVDNKVVDVTEFNILIISSFSMPEQISYTIAEETEPAPSMRTTSTKRKQIVRSKRNQGLLNWIATT
jgi:hypothetical protein